ncbi:LacI family DNA-binding transcriptional regulator [Oceanirhabdus sp. W0125-5]|uniref:LacI family DNA-binding transcriptional regulator n=1 Tax=Oceanirhabdus sp. W0125-5 TaxID=2999116 RepID=UPI0022F2E847|nr:LacI family DNA-binding transcriptional regulator [Oceanirhabdus sp. W0125-5]WBW97846.1 LacI family DNA-binding transcriptional regulator [Oceanirhabdus sp. W0125-5]
MKMSDIAKLAGVSKATVSRVINDSQNVSSELRLKVEKVIKETGYKPNLLAQELATNKTNMIGIILPNIGIDTFSSVTEGITDILESKGYNVLLANSNENIEKEVEYIKIFNRKQVDGIIIFPVDITQMHIDAIDSIKVPVVVIGQENENLQVSSVLYDDFNAVKDITKLMIRNGHKKIAYIGLDDRRESIGKLRRAGYIEAMKLAQIPIREEYIQISNLSILSGYEAMKHIIDRNKELPTAVVAAADRLAIGAMKYLKEKKFKIPEEVSVVGIDNMEISSIIEPSLTTVDFDYKKSGEKAAEMILNKIQSKINENEKYVLGYDIVRRKSEGLLK